ncbi:MAG: TM2 domain-containing protein [Verrucomicrobiae bacterium]|nr:TM2 domain-containing protein [Verrucomicrobiae bacterium]
MSDKPAGAEKKLAAGICGILLGALGIHKFILGYTTEGIIMLVASLVLGFFTCGAGAAVVGIIGLIEGIIYLTKSDEDFARIYVQGKKAWF